MSGFRLALLTEDRLIELPPSSKKLLLLALLERDGWSEDFRQAIAKEYDGMTPGRRAQRLHVTLGQWQEVKAEEQRLCNSGLSADQAHRDALMHVAVKHGIEVDSIERNFARLSEKPMALLGYRLAMMKQPDDTCTFELIMRNRMRVFA